MCEKTSGASNETVTVEDSVSGAYSDVSDSAYVKVNFSPSGQSSGTKTAKVTYNFMYEGWEYTWIYNLTATVKEKPCIYAGSYTWSSPVKYISVTNTGTVRLKNSGTKNLYFTSATITGTDSAQFQHISNYGSGTISPNTYRDIIVSYIASTAGIHTNAAIQINFTYDGESYTEDLFNLSGQTINNLYAQLWNGNELITQSLAPIIATNMLLEISHPYNGYNATPVSYPVKAGAMYAIITGFGSSENGKLLAARQKKIKRLQESGFAGLSPEILSESLHVIGQTWLQETALYQNMLNNIMGIKCVYHHRVGVVAQEEGYYVDIKAQYSTSVATGSDSGEAGLRAGSLLASAMEHGCLEQMQGTARQAVSTVKLLKIANDSNWKIYYVDSNNWNSVSNTLHTGGYTTEELSEFASSINNRNGIFILPQNRNVTLGQWSGKGYIKRERTPSWIFIGMIIGGGYNGGYGAETWMLETSNQNIVDTANWYPPVEQISYRAADPVDMTSGAYTYQHQDIKTGGA